MIAMFARALVVWFGILLVAVANGGMREVILLPRLGDTAAHATSSIVLAAVILLVSRFTIGWLGPLSNRDAWTIGSVWAALTLAFEFLAGHYVFGDSWNTLVAEYNVLQPAMDSRAGRRVHRARRGIQNQGGDTLPMTKSLPAADVFVLQSLITATDGGIASRVLFTNTGGNLTLFAFDAGQGLPSTPRHLQRSSSSWTAR